MPSRGAVRFGDGMCKLGTGRGESGDGKKDLIPSMTWLAKIAVLIGDRELSARVLTDGIRSHERLLDILTAVPLQGMAVFNYVGTMRQVQYVVCVTYHNFVLFLIVS